MRYLMLDHVVLIGMNYQPLRSTGDKNFWVELIPFLAKNLKRVTVISIRKHHKSSEDLTVNGARLIIKYIPPKFLETPDATYEKEKFFWKKSAFPRKMGVIEKLLNARKLLQELNRIYNEYPYQHLHLMDNMGLANRMIAEKNPTTLSVSAMSYHGKRNNFIYEKFLTVSYRHHNISVVPYSKAYQTRLLKLGISNKNIRHIPWGIKCNTCDSRETQKTDIGISNDKPLILWTGYIQQIQRNDFLFAAHTSINALKQGLNANFYFAFKPECFENGFENYHRPEEGIFVKPTDASGFEILKKSCDIMFSPVVNSNVILAPPLTWLEMLNNGVPIVTTDVPGASEAVINGETGIIVNSEKELIKKLFFIVENYQEMKKNCKDIAKLRYNIDVIAENYLNLWNDLVLRRGSSHK
ncbi:glycosyltransferase family 4 protein [Desulfococcaceae bacterium HSG8]|nr:glycosyltransferase family 4 protein [Desulfococcaceae bacterium HSG8]